MYSYKAYTSRDVLPTPSWLFELFGAFVSLSPRVSLKLREVPRSMACTKSESEEGESVWEVLNEARRGGVLGGRSGRGGVAFWGTASGKFLGNLGQLPECTK